MIFRDFNSPVPLKVEQNGNANLPLSMQSSMLLTVEGKELKGFFGQVIMELEKALNFTIDFVAPEQDYGSFNITTKRWSGAMRLVASGAVDIGVSDFSMTNARLDYVDFTIPLLTTRINLYMREPEFFGVKWFAYYKVHYLGKATRSFSWPNAVIATL